MAGPGAPGGKSADQPGQVALPAGEVVPLQEKPVPDVQGAHFAALGIRAGVASAVYWPETISGRQIMPDETGLVAQSAAARFDSALISLLGRYQAGTLTTVVLDGRAV